MKKRFCLATALICITLMLGITTVSAQNAIRIGVDTPLTGSGATPGHYLLWGVQIATDEINAKGGLLGQKVELVVRDDETQVQKSILNIKELVFNEKVSAVLGPVNSGSAIAFLPILQKEQVPAMVLVATAAKITELYQNEPKNYTFRTALQDDGQVKAIAKHVVNKYKKIGVAVDSTGYGQFGQESLLAELKKYNVKPVEMVKFNLGDTDMTSQLSKLKAAGCDCVVVYSLGPENANLMRSADKINFRPTFVGPWTFFHYEVSELPARISNGMVGVLSSTAFDSEKAKEIDGIVKKKYVKDKFYSFTFIAVSYEGAMLMYDAIKRAKSTDPKAIRDALEATDKFQGISKTFIKPFSNKDHNLYEAEDMFLGVWKDGQVVKVAD